ncbi:MAG: hypothetical protein AVDCRST_MAG15-1618 [uncultured Rubellimicrobium sp.]|uniref:Glycosyltransferase RgtA/B/C/D-like domain-containing protein n=1 Tax=uncultured Rubellimicrobium sp. TaxID=543078 RepID=A0A6J4NXF5_9RHOB|nr:MAG: hypothetical protein AVDCRST_MAG15-1618 [uncultured Rubellimicrobium sp.]
MPRTVGTRFVLLVVGYFALQLVLRLLIGPSLELDEAEAFFHARQLSWGYGAQPPFYFWLQWALFQVVGEGLFALALLKALILAGTVIGLFLLLREEVGDEAGAVAALSLGLLPQVMWEGQRALTHSMLALLMAVVTAGLAVRALRSGHWRDHLGLGVAVGLGVLSKFNFALWPVGLLLAAAALPAWRLRPLRILAAVGAAVAVVAPVGIWMWRNPDLSTASLEKLEVATDGAIMARLIGTGEVVGAALAFLALAAVVLGVFWLKAGQGGGRSLGPVGRLLGAAAGLSFLCLWLGILATGATEIAERWLLPFAWAVVPVGVLLLWPGMAARAQRGLAGAVGALWLIAMAALPYASLVDPGWRGAEFGPLVQRLEEMGAGERGLRVQSQWVAANIALIAPGMEPRLLKRGEAPGAGVVLVLDEAGLPGSEGSRESFVIPRGQTDVRVALATAAE